MNEGSSRYDMPSPTKKDLEDAAEFRDKIHAEVLRIVHKTRPDIESVIDPYPVENYYEWNWEYPGAWYFYVSIPSGFRSRDAFVGKLVEITLAQQK